VQGLLRADVRGTVDGHGVPLLLDGDAFGQFVVEFALGAFDVKVGPGHLHSDLGGNADVLFAYA
jgi:hypothetical protein